MNRYCFSLQVRPGRLAEFFDGNENRTPDEAFTLLTEVFHYANRADRHLPR